jgi:phosphopantothenoylcysteine decarboxylase/phosphopantothenate--cysteine ligase
MKVLLGLSGSIAAYKSLELARLLIKQGSEVRFILTNSALNFVTPLSCQTLSNSEVYFDQFLLTKGIKHLSLNEWADIFVIAPATANVIGKAACGIGDDLLSTALLSFQKPVLFVPAMDQGMWDNPIVQKNVSFLKDTGFHFLEPVVGVLASGKIGRGRFPSIDIVVKKIIAILEKRVDLGKKKFLVTGGRTEEDLDPVRVVTNRSSGRMAVELVQAIHCRGGDVRGIFGEVTCELPQDIEISRVRTSDEMLGALRDNFAWCDCLIMAAAIGDYRPSSKSAVKVHDKAYRMDFQKNIDLLKEITKHKAGKIVVGFSLEDDEQLSRARDKMKAKNLDMIVFNSTAAIGARCVTASIIKKTGKPVKFERQAKWEIANRILDECTCYLTDRSMR